MVLVVVVERGKNCCKRLLRKRIMVILLRQKKKKMRASLKEVMFTGPSEPHGFQSSRMLETIFLHFQYSEWEEGLVCKWERESACLRGILLPDNKPSLCRTCGRDGYGYYIKVLLIKLSYNRQSPAVLSLSFTLYITHTPLCVVVGVHISTLLPYS